MNRKKDAKEQAKLEKYFKDHPFDDPCSWVGQRFDKAPWTDEQIADYQKKLDSAFGAENAIVLAWSGDRRYWDEFYTEWHPNGLPKEGSLEKKPILLYGSISVNPLDYVYVITPRWMLLERLHPSQYESSWESDSWVEDEDMVGGRKRIRTEKPPKAFYHVLRTIAEHGQGVMIGEKPPCCQRLYKEMQRICYGRYRPPSDAELAFVRSIRSNMDAAGVVQRNDTERSQKVLQRAKSNTKFYMQQAERQRNRSIKENIMRDPMMAVQGIVDAKGITMSKKEIEALVLEGINQSQQERAAASKINI